MVSTSIKECTFKYFEKEKKDFFTKMDKKSICYEVFYICIETIYVCLCKK